VRCWRGCKRALERAVGGDKPARGRWRPGTCAGGAERLGQDRTRSDSERQGLLHLEAGSAVRRRCSDSESSGSDARSTSSAAAAAKQAFAKPVSARLLGRAVVGLFVARSRPHHPSLDLCCSPSGLPVPAPSQRAPGSAAGAGNRAQRDLSGAPTQALHGSCAWARASLPEGRVEGTGQVRGERGMCALLLHWPPAPSTPPVAPPPACRFAASVSM